MEFTKWQGCGNDFIVIDFIDKEPVEFGKLSQQMCDRHYGIGADGLMVVLPSLNADFRMRIFNPDGTEPEMCGNGLRCFARYLYDYGLTTKVEFTVETGSGTLIPRINLAGNQVSSVSVDMGEPILAGDDIPVAGFGQQRVINKDITVDDTTYKMTGVSMGNPHAVIFVDDVEGFPLAELGSKFETHELFPRKTNTEFVEVTSCNKARMRVWERGAGITLACGTGACAALVAGVLSDRLERQAEIILDGGRLNICWRDDNHIVMTGPAEPVFTGTWNR